MTVTIIHEGRMHPNVAASAPGIPAILIPTKVAEFTAIGPGVICEIEIKSVNSTIVSQPCLVTICSCINGIAAYPPPKLNNPTCRKLKNSCK